MATAARAHAYAQASKDHKDHSGSSGYSTGPAGTYRKRSYGAYLKGSGSGEYNHSRNYQPARNGFGQNNVGKSISVPRSSGQYNLGRSNQSNQPRAAKPCPKEVQACYNCGDSSHIARDCGKPKKS